MQGGLREAGTAATRRQQKERQSMVTIIEPRHRQVLDVEAAEFHGLDPVARAKLITLEHASIAKASLSSAVRRSERRLEALQHSAAWTFGEARGWRLSRSTFGFVTLARSRRHGGWRRYDHQADNGNGYFDGESAHACDHPQWYRRDRKAAAIVAHLYGWPDCRPACEALAARYGLELLVPDLPSWWVPHRTQLIAYIGPAGAGGRA
jgi:hypothetical protein